MIPTTEQFGGADALEKAFLFTIDDVPYYWITEKPDLDKGGFTYTQLDTIRGRKPKQNIFAIATANSLRSWYLGNKYCSSCRTPMKRSGYERALVCPECGRILVLDPKPNPGAIGDIGYMWCPHCGSKALRRTSLAIGKKRVLFTTCMSCRYQLYRDTMYF